jgi:hypothetical protein
MVFPPVYGVVVVRGMYALTQKSPPNCNALPSKTQAFCDIYHCTCGNLRMLKNKLTKGIHVSNRNESNLSRRGDHSMLK